MKLKLLLVGLVVFVLVVFGVPYISWTGVADNPDGVLLTLDVTAYCESYGAKAVFTHTSEYDDLSKPTYSSYFGDFWTFDTGTVLPAYPLLATLIRIDGDLSSRQDTFTAYTYGTTLAWSGEFMAEHGDKLVFQFQIYYAQSISSSIGWTEVVP